MIDYLDWSLLSEISRAYAKLQGFFLRSKNRSGQCGKLCQNIWVFKLRKHIIAKHTSHGQFVIVALLLLFSDINARVPSMCSDAEEPVRIKNTACSEEDVKLMG